jgi:hypothetical protein
MLSKEEYYLHVLENRRIVKDPENIRCNCRKTKCEWHGKCLECVTLHRYYRDHIPECFQQYVNEKIGRIAQIGELILVEKEKAPAEYWDYVREKEGENDVKG